MSRVEKNLRSSQLGELREIKVGSDWGSICQIFFRIGLRAKKKSHGLRIAENIPGPEE